MNATATPASPAQFSEIRNLLTVLGELDTAERNRMAAMLNYARTSGSFDTEVATGAARQLRNLIADRRMVEATPAQRTGATPYITEEAVPAGRYALDGTGTNETVFYVVKWWDGWSGRRFSVYLQVSDNETKVRFEQAKGVLARIAEDPYAALIRYGKELGVCGDCGRTLTSDDSRAKGIGPICESKR